VVGLVVGLVMVPTGAVAAMASQGKIEGSSGSKANVLRPLDTIVPVRQIWASPPWLHRY
jgi:hypothetical protein